MNLKAEMEKRGAGPTQVNSKSVAMVEQIIAEESGAIDRIGYEAATRIKDEIRAEVTKAQAGTKMLKEATQEFNEAYRKINGMNMNPQTAEIVALYKTLLNTTMECIGAETGWNYADSEVVRQAVEGSSYIIWKCLDEGVIAR